MFMWKWVVRVAIFIASLTAFILAVLTIMKDHLGIDTHALLMHLGAGLASALADAETALHNIAVKLPGWLRTAAPYISFIASLLGLLSTLRAQPRQG